MPEISIDLTGEDIESLTLENEFGFEWTVSLGSIRVTVTDEQLLAVAAQFRSKFGDEK